MGERVYGGGRIMSYLVSHYGRHYTQLTGLDWVVGLLCFIIIIHTHINPVPEHAKNIKSSKVNGYDDYEYVLFTTIDVLYLHLGVEW